MNKYAIIVNQQVWETGPLNKDDTVDQIKKFIDGCRKYHPNNFNEYRLTEYKTDRVVTFDELIDSNTLMKINELSEYGDEYADVLIFQLGQMKLIFDGADENGNHIEETINWTAEDEYQYVLLSHEYNLKEHLEGERSLIESKIDKIIEKYERVRVM